MCSRKLGTQPAVSSTTPMRRSREALERPVEDEIGQSDGRGQPQEDGVEQQPAVIGLAHVPGRMERALEARDVEDRRHALVAEGGPHRIEVGMRERLPVDRRRGDHGQAHTLGAAPGGSPRTAHVGIVQQAGAPRRRGARRRRRRRRPRSGCRPGRWPAARPVLGQPSSPTAARSWGTGPRRRSRSRRAAPAGARPSRTRPAPAPRTRPAAARRAAAAGDRRRWRSPCSGIGTSMGVSCVPRQASQGHPASSSAIDNASSRRPGSM